jgi:hypothetical protein
MSLPCRVVCPERSQRETNVPLSGTAFFREEKDPFASERRRIPHRDNTCSLPVLRHILWNQDFQEASSLRGVFLWDFRIQIAGSVRGYLRFALNRYSTPTEIAKLTSNWVIFDP